MKKSIYSGLIRNKIILMAALASTAIFLSISTSCYVGADGHPGLAYVAFEWEHVKPDYIDCGTPAVPPQFNYGTFYRISPGWYNAYYEGKVWNGQAWMTFSFSMDYEIWINEGQRGGYGYNGKDGMNTYLTFMCSPYGPYLKRNDAYYRTASPDDELAANTKGIPEIDKDVVREYKEGDYTIRLTYRRVDPIKNKPAGNFPLN